MLRLVSLAGLLVLLALCYALSRNRRAVSFRLVGMGLLIQAVLGGLFLYWDTGNQWLQGVGHGVKRFLDLSQRGTEFVFGDLGRNSSPDNLLFLRSADGRRFAPEGLLAMGAAAPALAVAQDGNVIAVFERPAPDMPRHLGELAAAVHDGASWQPPRTLQIEDLPDDLQGPFQPCVVALADGRYRLYFTSVHGLHGESATYSAVSVAALDPFRYRFEPGVRLAVPAAPVTHPAVAKHGGRWHLYAPVRAAPGTAYHGVSSDGLTFARRDDIELRGAGAWVGSALASGEDLRFYGSGWWASSADGIDWTVGAGLRLDDGNDVDPAVVQAPDGSYWMSVPARPGFGFLFFSQVLPTLIFFSSIMAVLYYLGAMQLVVKLMAIVMARLLGTSGAESLSACGNVFVGQTEAPLMVRPYLPKMTTSELHAVMTGGYATIAGGVFALYVGFGIDPGNLVVASVMAVPAGLVCSKLLWPETEHSETMGRVVLSRERSAGNVVEAAANGGLDGLRLALNVGAMLIAFLGIVAVLDWLLGYAGDVVGYDQLSVGTLLGWLFSPVAAVMGVPSHDILALGELLGTKLALTELVAFQQLGEMEAAHELSPRTVRIASFALCGFANFGSVAIQIGGLGAMAPDRKPDIARLALRAMFAGAIATCVTACMAGVMSDV